MVSVKAALLSVIIPVYNVEPYLEQCLDSVVNQTYKNLEIICINDGSTDNSLKILEKYQKKDKRIKIINQENKGVSAARNAGVDIATGEYITFVDSDDYLELNAYEEAMKVMLQDRSVDLIEFGIKPFTTSNDIVNKNRVNDIREYYRKRLNLVLYSGVVWNKIFNLKRIKDIGITFPVEIRLFEDLYFSYAYAININKQSFVDLALYNYRVRCGSIVRQEINTNWKHCFDMYYGYDMLISFAKNCNKYNLTKACIFNDYLYSIYKFCDDKNRLLKVVLYWDQKILNSDCPDYLKLKYIKKRHDIIYVVEHPVEYSIIKYIKEFFDIIK